ncbi:metallophosphoesterase [Azotosporobacter soli]|uniref:metallophosphoesterase n=1 Tax=Azotosporobacter soli TaxID=3055040 RepID=UPI0031FF0A4C
MNLVPSYLGFLFSFTLIYLFANLYIARRTWRQLAWPLCRRRLFCTALSVAALLYPAGRIVEALSGAGTFSYLLTLCGAYWLAATFYLFWLIALGDLLRFLLALSGRPLPFAPRRLAAGQWLLMFLLVGYGAYNASQPVLKNYELRIAKAAPTQSELRIAMVSDIHLGSLIGVSQLTPIVERINALKPDLVLLPGDIIDGPVAVLADGRLCAEFRRLEAPLGVYGCMGNHEYTDRQPEEFIRYMKEANVMILRDEIRLINNNFYLAGRDDLSAQRFRNQERQPLSELLQNIDAAKPLLLLDHQPKSFAEAVQNSVDLQLSGHTHLGQLFPNQLITALLYQLDYGYLSIDRFQAVVSCGIGTWGPPVRLGNRPEIVLLTIHFKP